jgi:hypothetical protein
LVGIAACGGETGQPYRLDASSEASSDAGDDAPNSDPCVTVDIATYDTSCRVDSDCVLARVGVVCSGGFGCICGGAAINIDGQARYITQTAKIQGVIGDPGPCACAAVSAAKCVLGPSGGVCADCPYPSLWNQLQEAGIAIPAGCPDGG